MLMEQQKEPVVVFKTHERSSSRALADANRHGGSPRPSKSLLTNIGGGSRVSVVERNVDDLATDPKKDEVCVTVFRSWYPFFWAKIWIS